MWCETVIPSSARLSCRSPKKTSWGSTRTLSVYPRSQGKAFHPLSFTAEHQAGNAWLQKSQVSLHIQADSQHHLRDYNLQRAIIRT